ncbi:unnamed protein product [Ascophyllum nodosum]
MRGLVDFNDRDRSSPPQSARKTSPLSTSSSSSSPPSVAATAVATTATDGGRGGGSGSKRHKLVEGLELTRKPWLRHGEGTASASAWAEQRETGLEKNGGNGRESSVAMGGANGKSRGSGTASVYEAVEREEPLLLEAMEVLPPEEDRGQEMPDNEAVSAGLLWSSGRGDKPSLRSRGDPSLGPAFGRRPGSGSMVVIDGNSTSREAEEGMDGDPRWGTGNGGREEDRSWAVSGRPLVYLCAVCSSLCSILLGYDVGVMSGAKEYIRPDLHLSEGRLQVVVGSLNIVAAFGGLLAGKTADRLGRKPTTALACIVFIVGATIMTMSRSFEFLLLGRVVTGVGVGCAMVIAPVYITELAPPDVRGMLVSLTDICINIGIVLGYAASLVCADVFATDSGKWRSMIGIGMLPPVLILACLTIMPESPRWLICAGRKAEALHVLKRVLGNDREAEESLETISQGMSNQEATWRDVLLPRDRVVKAAMIVAVGLGFWQQASGSEAAVYYTPEVLKTKGWDDKKILIGNIGVGGFKLLGEVVAFMLLDRIGRRPLFLVSSVLVTLCLVMVGNSFFLDWSTRVVLFWLCMFMFCFSLGLGPVTFVVASEILPVTVRSKAMSVVICINRLMSGVIALSYESMSFEMSNAGSFYFFAWLSAFSIAFYAYWVPETRGRTLEEITADLGASTSSAPGIQVGHRGARHHPLPDIDEDDEEAK